MAAPRDLRLLTGAVFATALGDFVALTALILHVHDLTASGWAVAGLMAATMAPIVLLAPVAGLLVDRLETVRLLAAVSLLQVGAAVALAFVDGLAGVLLLTALLGAGASVAQPSEFALVPTVAGEDNTQKANGWVETARYAGFAAGPVAAGVLVAGGGTRVALLVNAISFLFVAVAAVAMRSRRPGHARRADQGDRAREGFAILRRDPIVRIVVTAATAALLVISAVQTVEVFYVKDVLGAGNLAYGATMGAWMLGMVAGALGLAHRFDRSKLASTALAALALQGVGLALSATWAILPVALAGFMFGGVAHGVKNVLIRTLIQERTPERVHGRAFAAYNAARNTAEMGALGLGAMMVAGVGAQAALIIAGMGPVVAGTLGLFALRARTVGAREPGERDSQPAPAAA